MFGAQSTEWLLFPCVPCASAATRPSEQDYGCLLCSPACPSRHSGGGGRDTPDHSGICIWKRFLESCPSKGPSVILDTLALWGVTLNDVHLPQGRGLRARSEADVGLIPINYF